MSYTTRAAVVAKLPERFLLEVLDDDGDGEEDAGMFDAILANADTEIDGYLEGRYDLPVAPVPAKVQTAALAIVLEDLYYRRGLTRDQNPWANRASECRAFLRRVQSGDDSLIRTVEQGGDAITVVAEPARTHSSGNRLMA